MQHSAVRYPARYFLSQFLHIPCSRLGLWVTESHGCMVDTSSELCVTHTHTGQLHQNTALVESCFFFFPSDPIQRTSDRLTCEGRKGTYERKHPFFPAMMLPGSIHIIFHQGWLFTWISLYLSESLYKYKHMTIPFQILRKSFFLCPVTEYHETIRNYIRAVKQKPIWYLLQRLLHGLAWSPLAGWPAQATQFPSLSANPGLLTPPQQLLARALAASPPELQ